MPYLFFRQAFELAWGNAYIFCRERPYTVYMDDISFEAPVEVGNLLYFNSQISFVHQHYIQVSLISDTIFLLKRLSTSGYLLFFINYLFNEFLTKSH